MKYQLKTQAVYHSFIFPNKKTVTKTIIADRCEQCSRIHIEAKDSKPIKFGGCSFVIILYLIANIIALTMGFYRNFNGIGNFVFILLVANFLFFSWPILIIAAIPNIINEKFEDNYCHKKGILSINDFKERESE